MSRPDDRPRLVRRWEALPVFTQLAIAFPTLAALAFLLNLGPFSQPVGRSIVYAVIEGGVLTGALLTATAQEKARPTRRPPSPAQVGVTSSVAREAGPLISMA